MRARIRHLKAYAAILRTVPYLTCIILTGSMTSDSVKESSDIDLMIIARGGRIFTVRFLSILLATLTGLKRSSKESAKTAGRFCLNYFVSDDFLLLPTGRGVKIDNYCANDYGRSILVAGDQKIFDKFIAKNRRLLKINKSARYSSQKYQIKEYKIQTLIRNIWQVVLNGSFGDKIEAVLRSMQVKRIKNDSRTKKFPNLIAFSNRELRFHPPKNTLEDERLTRKAC